MFWIKDGRWPLSLLNSLIPLEEEENRAKMYTYYVFTCFYYKYMYLPCIYMYVMYVFITGEDMSLMQMYLHLYLPHVHLSYVSPP